VAIAGLGTAGVNFATYPTSVLVIPGVAAVGLCVVLLGDAAAIAWRQSA
jgi:hypothetical protein